MSTALGTTALAASSLETDSYEEELSTAVLKNDWTMTQVPKEDISLRTDDATVMSSAPRSRLARSDTMEASLQSSQLPNLGKFEPLSTLKDEFKFNKSFGEKVDGLIEHEYKGWRRVRGDGNCFYRAVGFGLLEQIIAAPDSKRQVAASALVCKLKNLSFEEKAEDEGHQQFVERLFRLASGHSWQDGGGLDLLASFEDKSPDGIDQACIRAIRKLVAQCIITRADDCSLCGGIDFRTLCEVQGLGSPEDFCNTVVLPMGVEAESVVMNALVCALDVGLKLALLDRTEQSGLVFESYEPPGEGNSDHFTVHVQLRPGHYDLLYLECVNETSRRRATIDGSGGYGRGAASSPKSSAETTLEPFRL